MLLKSSVVNSLNNLLKPQALFSYNSIRGYKALTPKEFEEFNEKIYPPQGPDETPRPAFVCHAVENVKYSPKKLWYIACFIRGMSIDEALKQLLFVKKKGAGIVREALLQAQAKAVNDHGVEFKSNLWVSESFVERGLILKGLRRVAKGGMNKIRYRYSHYFVTLEEGTPPKDYYYFTRKKSGEELLSQWLDKHRKKKITHSFMGPRLRRKTLTLAFSLRPSEREHLIEETQKLTEKSWHVLQYMQRQSTFISEVFNDFLV